MNDDVFTTYTPQTPTPVKPEQTALADSVGLLIMVVAFLLIVCSPPIILAVWGWLL